MKIFRTVAELRQGLKVERLQDNSIGFVPTMGNLHAGHLSLVTEAQEQADKVIVSIFVNPTQFGANEDLDAYPRTEARDIELLEAANVDYLFLPSVSEMYPQGDKHLTEVIVPKLTDNLCGASRPGHFNGVSSVVTKLFNMVQPDVACFGSKDYQQLRVIQKMVEDLSMPVRVVAVPTARDIDSLALSSRNQYLSADERAIAPKLYESMQIAAAKIKAGVALIDVKKSLKKKLAEHGFAEDYIEFVDSENLSILTETKFPLTLAIAARLGKTRLIDNLQITTE